MATMVSKLVKIVRDISIEDQSLYTKFVISSLFMFAIPLALVTYLIYVEMTKSFSQPEFTYARFIILLIIASGLVGYIIIRRSVSSVLRVIKQAKAIASGQEESVISVAHDDELKDLAAAFNHITSDLEKKIRELEYSKNLTRELFLKIENVVTSVQKIDALLTLLVQSTQKVLRAKAGFIVLYDSNYGKLLLKAYSGPQKHMIQNMFISDKSGIVGMVMQKKAAVVQDKADDDAFTYENILAVPIMAKDKVTGVFAVMDLEDPVEAEKEDAFIMSRVAGSIASTVENFELNKNIEETYYETLLTLARVMEAKDRYSAGHLERVSDYVELMAEKLGLPEDARRVLIGGAFLHDLGKVGIRDEILNKKGTFTQEEYSIMKEHSVIGENILKPLRSMTKLAELVRYHHELYDGSGYPDGLKGEAIPLLARVLTIADMYDAMTSDRPYRKALPKDEAMKIIKSYAGTKLDPYMVKVFVEVMEKANKQERRSNA